MPTDLGFERPDYSSVNPASEEDVDTKIVYPTAYIDSNKKLDIPKKGKITFEYELKSTTVREKKDKDEPECSYELELKSIVSTEKSSDKKEKSSEEALDSLRKKKDDSEDTDDDYSDESDE